MDTDLARRLDGSIGSAPEADDGLPALLALGQRAVRRRRLAAAGASALAVLVVAGGVAVATGGPPSRASAPVATPPSSAPDTPRPTPVPSEPPSAGPSGPLRWDADVATFDLRTGELVIDPRVTVVERVENPYAVSPPAASVGLSLRGGGQRWWYALYYAPGGGATVTEPAGDGSFSAWLAQQGGIVPAGSPPPASPDPDGGWPGEPRDDLVRFASASGEVVRAVGGAELLDQRAGVDVGASFAAPGDDTAAALVRSADGAAYYVLARRVPGQAAQYIAVPRARGGADLDAFLDLARRRYAEGGGGLL